jgi:hypothetical protein
MQKPFWVEFSVLQYWKVGAVKRDERSGAFRRIFKTPFEIKLTNFNKIDVYLGMCKHLKNRYHG